MSDQSQVQVNPDILPQYQCHKKVRALKIETLEPIIGRVHLAASINGLVGVDESFIAKHKPEVGGYWVLYDDGYQSYSPAKAFEEGYTRISPILPAPETP